jgi:hypothetical protein
VEKKLWLVGKVNPGWKDLAAERYKGMLSTANRSLGLDGCV